MKSNSAALPSVTRQFVMSALLALLLLALNARALPLSSVEFDEPDTLMLVRPWADAAPAEWRGQWIRRLSPRVGHLGQLGLVGPAMQVQKKWTRLEPSIRFY